jgi:hypothetical protein
MSIIKGVDVHQVDASVDAGRYLITRNGIFSIYLNRMVGTYRERNGVRMGFGRVDIGNSGYLNIGKLIAAVYNAVPYTVTSRVFAKDGNYCNVCPENIEVIEQMNAVQKVDLKGVDANLIDSNIPEGYYTILKGGVYSHRINSMIGKYRKKNGLILDFGMVELGRGSTYNVGKLIAAAYNGVPYRKFDISLPRDGNYKNICPENIFIVSRSVYCGKTFEPFHKENTKISAADVLIIRESKESNISLSKKYGVSHMQISRIKRGLDRINVV